MNFEELLTVVIPTYNHPQMIDYILDNYSFIDDYNLLVQIHDSSTNNETKDVVDKYKYKNLEYYKYDSKMNVDVKTIIALATPKTKYVYLCGDGILINKDFIHSIYHNLLKDFDIVELYDESIPRHINFLRKLTNNKLVMEYNSIQKHFLDNFWHMPFYGGSIIKTEVFKSYDLSCILNKKYSGFIYPSLIYTYFATRGKFNAISLGENFLLPNKFKKESGWVTNCSFLQTWIDNFDETVYELPSIYDTYKKAVIRNTGINTEFFSFKSLIFFKKTNNYNFKLYKKYKEKILERTNLNSFSLWFIAIFPNFILKFIKKVKRLFKRK